MKRIYIVVAGIVLIILIIISIILSLAKKPTSNNQSSPPFPTSIPLQGVSNVSPQITALPSDITNSSVNVPIDISAIAPVEAEDFNLHYSSELNKIVVERITSQADQSFNDWAAKNNYPQLINNPDKVSIVDLGKASPDTQPLFDILNIFMNFGQGGQKTATSNQQSAASFTSVTQSSTSSTHNSSPSSYSYYAQCGDEGNLPLPDGGTLCSAGCGPTSVAMIASSYVSKQYDPKAIVNLYKANNYLLGSGGSRYQDAHELLKSLGLKTTDYIEFNSEKADTVVPELRKYLDAGWTFFTMAIFDNGIGHYFWITDIDSKGNIFAYDPAYGRYEIPYNENSRYPYPLYMLAFGVKK